MDRKEQILDVAAEMIQTKSFSAFSYQDLSDRLGIRKASIHHHFASKEILAVRLVQRYRAQVDAMFTKINASTDDPWERLEMYVGGACSVGDGKRICPSGSLEADYSSIPDAVRRELEALNQRLTDWTTGVLQDGLDQGVMRFPGTARRQASLIRAAIQGGLQMQRAEDDETVSEITEQLLATMRV